MNPLQTQELFSHDDRAMPLNDRARARIREEKARRGLSERDLAGFINWSQSKVAQKLAGRTPMTLDEFEALCFALGLRPTEAVRDRGLEFAAEMTPTELRILETLRRLPKPTFDAILHLLHVQLHDIETRGITKKKSTLGKPRASHG